MHDGLIFDLDGTLWDSTQACASGWTEGLRHFQPEGKVFSREDLAGIMGMTFDKVIETLIPDSDPAKRVEMGQYCYEKELEHIEKIGAPLYEGVAEGLVELSRLYPLFLVSNCLEDYLDSFYKITGLGKLFKDSECFGRTGKSKSHNIKAVMDRNRLKQAAYVGDTGGDQQAAILAGATYYHVNYGFGRPSVECMKFSDFSDVVSHFASQKR